jgi:2-polyprenyl-3-methyl-5-hydroxy-6-metoxy-1,4-benzoquinol methylase
MSRRRVGSMVPPSVEARIELEARPCPICKRVDQQHLVREANLDFERLNAASFSSRKLPEYMHCRLMKCGPCGLVYASPAPTPAFLAKSYRDASFDATRESEYAAKTYIACLRDAGSLRPVSALDIGAGDGAFLRELIQNGFDDVVGYEPSRAPVEAADPEIRARIRPELFDASRLKSDSLGLITCFQTIEHVYDPLRLVSDMRRVLRPGGTAFLIAHDIDAVSAKIMGFKSPIFDIEHLQLFNARSADVLMRTAGFREVVTFPIVNAYPIAYWARLFPLPESLKTPLLTALTGPLAWIGKRLLRLPAGNLAIIATK